MYSIPTDLVPQADKLEKVFDVVEAVLSGKSTAQEIAQVCNLPSKRQGGYYRLAAKSLDLIAEEKGVWSPTLLGEALANVDDHEVKVAMMRAVVLINPFVRRMYGHLEEAGADGTTKASLVALASTITDLSRSTAERRVDTVLRWFRYLRLTQPSGLRHRLLSQTGSS